jgi:hypothetical protein
MTVLLTSSRTRNHARINARVGDAFCLFLPLLIIPEINFIGRLFAIEVLLAILLPLLIFNSNGSLPHKERAIITICGLGGAWFLSQVVTDLYRNTPSEDYLRGWANIGFFLVNLSALGYLLRNRLERYALFAVGLAMSQIVGDFVKPSIFAVGDPWKFGYGVGLCLLFVMIAAGIQKKTGKIVLPSFVIVAIGIAAIWHGARNLGGSTILTGLLLIARPSVRQYLQTTRSRFMPLAIGAVAAVIFTYGVSELYVYGARSGLFGAVAEEKYQTQTEGDLPILIAGRPEIIASLSAIRDSPVLGHGSWAKDFEYISQLVGFLQEHGYKASDDLYDQDLIPAHSHITQAWVQAGVFGGIFWIYIAVIIMRALRRCFEASSSWIDPLVIYYGISGLWDVLFSPFGSERRITVAFLILVMLQKISQSQRPAEPFKMGA